MPYELSAGSREIHARFMACDALATCVLAASWCRWRLSRRCDLLPVQAAPRLHCMVLCQDGVSRREQHGVWTEAAGQWARGGHATQDSSLSRCRHLMRMLGHRGWLGRHSRSM